MTSLKEIKTDKLVTNIYEGREELGKAAAEDMIEIIKNLMKQKEKLRIVFAAAPSQNEFLNEMLSSDIDWNKIEAFHMDEYIGLPKNAPQTFGHYLRENIFDKVDFSNINYIDPSNNPEEECERYAALLKEAPIDIVFMGIGENGHIAFNDPPVADFEDEKFVKVVELDEPCRVQQVNDGCFPKFEDVPKTAFTLTVPALMSADYLSVCVPGITKAVAVKNTLKGEISTKCPATILRTHKQAKLYIDTDSASLL
ncbi:MAG: glucosamine-6-phosphate deaminase [Rhodothermaceae bacterium]